MGSTRVRPVLGLPERVADVDVRPGRHGDLPEAVRGVSRVFRAGSFASRRVGCWPVRDLGTDRAQPHGGPPCWRKFGAGGFVHHLGLSRVGGRFAGTCDAHTLAALRRTGSIGRKRVGRRAVDRPLELHRMGQRLDGAGRGAGCYTQLSARLGLRIATCRGRVCFHCSPRCPPRIGGHG